jgi:HEAT repeat protein
MKRSSWRLVASGMVLAGLAAPMLRADETVTSIILRESGKPDRNCIIEKSTPQADGSIVHEVSDAATGEKMRIVDQRRNKSAPGLVKRRPSSPAATENAPAIPAPISMTLARQDSPRVTTNAELAAKPAPPASPYFMRKSDVGTVRKSEPAPERKSEAGPVRKSEPSAGKPARNPLHPALVPMPESPLQKQIGKLKDALGPSEREMAALSLTAGPDRASAPVIAALTHAAKNDPAPTVRACCVRCLLRLSTDAPQVVPKLLEMQNDPNDSVKKTAEEAVQQIARSARD